MGSVRFDTPSSDHFSYKEGRYSTLHEFISLPNTHAPTENICVSDSGFQFLRSDWL